MIKLTNVRPVTADGILEATAVYLDGEKIKAVGEKGLSFDVEIDGGGRYLAPGFIDTHVHGGGNADFMDGGVAPMVQAAKAHLAHGTTTIYPTTLSASPADLLQAIDDFKALKENRANEILPNLPGMHFEGPYFAVSQCGAQPPHLITPPIEKDYTEMLARAEGLIKKWSFAPELPGALSFCDDLVKAGVMPCIGHTEATFEDVKAAYEHGAKSLTHFYSSMSTITRRDGYRIAGVVEAGYLLDGLLIEIIADGHHLPRPILQMILKLIDNKRITPVTDAMRGASMPEGPSVLGKDWPCIIEGGVAKMPDRKSFAGSVATADRLLKTLVEIAGLSLPKASAMLSANPARAMGLEGKGILAEGYDADLVLLDNDLSVNSVFVMGKKAL